MGRPRSSSRSWWSRSSGSWWRPMGCSLSASALAAVAFGPAEIAAPEPAGPLLGAVPVVTVAVMVGQPLQGGPGAVPVAAAAGGVAVWFGAQQPAQIGPVPLVGRRPPSRPAALVVTASVVAAVPGSLAGPIGRLAGERRGRRTRPVG